MSKKFFEYHCYQGHDSADAKLWYHSHQPVTVLALIYSGAADTETERAEIGDPNVYSVQFPDGFIGDAFEDELLASPDNYQSEFNPPKDEL